MSNQGFPAVAGALAFGCAILFSTAATAQTTDAPLLLVLDKDAVDYGPPPHLLPDGAVNPDVAGVGVREELPYFQAHVNAQVVLPAGQNGNDGWFALGGAPSAWSTDGSADDGLENFALAGPGLGSPDDEGNRESLLAAVPNVAPIRGDAFSALVGRTACAVVYAGDIDALPGNTSASLAGPTLGRIAFQVVSVIPTDDADRPNIQVQILEGHEVCSGRLAAFFMP